MKKLLITIVVVLTTTESFASEVPVNTINVKKLLIFIAIIAIFFAVITIQGLYLKYKSEKREVKRLEEKLDLRDEVISSQAEKIETLENFVLTNFV